ncbi:hypothetical protein T4D_11965, partial [Trichinella pseudospiralis]
GSPRSTSEDPTNGRLLIRRFSQIQRPWPRNSKPKANERLPELKFPVSSGKVLDFPTFWDRFQGSVHSWTDLDDASKFAYLLSSLSGEALAATQGCHRAGTRKGNLGNFETTVLDAERRNRSEEGDTKLFCLPACNGETEPAENGGLAIQRSRSFRPHWMDFAGPLLVRVRRKATSKCYVCLFTCMASRAVPQMTSAKVMEALRRFIARQGRPEIIQSDNFRSFKAAASELRQLWRHVNVERVQHRIQWNFIPERAPWMGGYWERLVHSIKESSLPQRQTTDIRVRRESRTPPVVAVPVADRLHVRRLPSCRSSRPGMAAISMWSTAMKPPMAVPSAVMMMFN